MSVRWQEARWFGAGWPATGNRTRRDGRWISAALLLMLVAASACGPRAAPVVGLTSSPCFFATRPLALTEAAGGPPKPATLRVEVRLPSDVLAPSRVRTWLSGRALVRVSTLHFVGDSVLPGLHELVTSADGLATRVDTISMPLPDDSILIVSLARRSSSHSCEFLTVPEASSPPWWKFWRRRE